MKRSRFSIVTDLVKEEEYLAATTDLKVEKVGFSTSSFQDSPATKKTLREERIF